MNFNRRHFMAAAATGITSLAAPRAFATPKMSERPILLGQAVTALAQHNSKLVNRDIMAIVDFSAHSRERRMQIVDLGNGKILSSHLVSHGKGSDPGNSGWVKKFSNRPGSNASSEGSYLTGETYYGKHGRSRRLHGLDPENNRAFQRAIVMHGADYVDSGMARNSGRIGRSLGCFALERGEISSVLDRLGPGRLLFASK